MKISPPLAIIALLFCIADGAGAQSLWSPGFKGYLTGRSSLQIGDLVSVTIDTNTKLSYNSSNVSDRTLTLEFKGGSAGNPLSFLPPGTSSDKTNLKGGEEIKLSTKLVARVQKLEPNGQAYVEGSRTLEVNGRAEMLSVSGWLAPPMMTDGSTIPFDDLADSKLVYSSTLIQSAPVLTQGDITQALSQASSASTAAGIPQAPGTQGTASAPAAPPSPPTASAPPSSGPPAAGQQAATNLQITNAKKRQLLLEYLNKMLDLMFSKGSP